jgi:outer membrane biogenesis lipoprotein LolB
MPNTLRLLFLVCSASLLLGGCAADAPKPTDPARISTLPQNRPERWESQGMLGGMMGTR